MPDQVTLLTRTIANDGYGAVTETYADRETVFCRWRPFDPGRDRVFGDRPTADGLFVFTVPWDTVVSETDRVRQGTLTYEITGLVSDKSFKVGQRVLAKRL